MGKTMTLYSGNEIDSDDFGRIYGGGSKRTLDKVRQLRVGDMTFEFTYRHFDRVQHLIDVLVAENARMASVLRFDARDKPIIRVRANSVPIALPAPASTLPASPVMLPGGRGAFLNPSVRSKASATKARKHEEHVERLVQFFAAKDPLRTWTWSETVHQLNLAGVPTARGKPWKLTTYRGNVILARQLVAERRAAMELAA